ncbi:MAG: ammonium transporter [Candidatus Methanoplasma sp.]|jgi:Amt family ammonium transporter|nr:ammonium transporter [Candidatus Methanoplasma sp.]
MKFRVMVALGVVAAALLTIFMIPEASAAGIPEVYDAESSINLGDSMWILICTILVFMMAPALALFYGGMLRKQSMTSTIAQCTMASAVVFLFWALIGYSFAFDGDHAGIIGGFGYAFMNNVPFDQAIVGGTIPDMEFLVFQGMFALVTACIVVGAVAERVRFSAIMVFLALWCVFIYAPMTHMVWGGGLLSPDYLTEIGLTSLDYAGGTVVHICSGVSGLAIAIVVGKRSARTIKERPHNVPLMYLGAIMLWLGWLGFNGGSGLAFNTGLFNVITVTLVSSFVAMIAWAVLQTVLAGRISVSGLCAGFLAGLVGITPACGFVDVPAAIVIGIVTAIICYFGISFMRKKSGVDDALDVFGLHGLGGITGAILTGVLAVPALTDTPGAIYGGWDLLGGQFVAVGFTLLYCFVVAFVLMKIISLVMKYRLTDDEEQIGADIVEHGESAYN